MIFIFDKNLSAIKELSKKHTFYLEINSANITLIE